MNRSVTPAEMSVILETLLASPPSSAGKRLRSERDLAALVGLDRMKVQKAFDLLVDKGILLRRHGSGTYVRKVPRTEAAPAAPASVNVGAYTLSSEQLFAAVSEKPLRWQIHRQRKLNLGVLPNLQWESASNRSVFEGIKSRIRQEGHLMTRLKLAPQTDAASYEKAVRKLRGSACDGYVLWSSYAGMLDRAFPGAKPPVVFIGARERAADLRCSPIVRVSIEDAIVRALGILAEEGYRKIGILGFQSIERDCEADRIVYRETMEKLGLAYRACEFCPLDDKAVMEAVRRMFGAKNRPEAVYVADDVLLHHVVRAWSQIGIVPGKNLGVVTLSSHGNPLPKGYSWSALEFNPFQVGRMAVDSLLQEIETVGEMICSFEHLAAWRPGSTHSL